MRPTADEIIEALVQAGVFPEDAIAAAADPRLAWSDDTLDGCLVWVDEFRGDVPGGTMLWNKYLKVGWFPPMPAPDDTTTCPFCKGDVAVCRGLHGYAAKLWRDLQAAETTEQEEAA